MSINMQKEKLMKRYTLPLLAISTILFSSISFANSINLFLEPKADSKIVATADSSAGVITIYAPKNSSWIKVADPRNGNVGWIKSREMGNTNISVNIARTGNGPAHFRYIQYTGNRNVSQQEIDADFRRMQQRQMLMQRRMAHMFEEMYGMFSQPTPVFMPVIVVPQTQQKVATSNVKQVSRAPQTKTDKTNATPKRP